MVPLPNSLKHAAACRSEPKFSWGPLVLAYGPIIPSSGSQQCRLEARHLRDVYSESYVTGSAEIVGYEWWLTRTALSADWNVMGVAWVVCDSLLPVWQ